MFLRTLCLVGLLVALTPLRGIGCGCGNKFVQIYCRDCDIDSGCADCSPAGSLQFEIIGEVDQLHCIEAPTLTCSNPKCNYPTQFSLTSYCSDTGKTYVYYKKMCCILSI